ncbi:MAG: hypothetical protein WAT79_01400 [Saprospiraceae bacterium]
MNNKKFVLIICTVILLSNFSNKLNAQFGGGLTMNYNFYERYTNPKDASNEGQSSGSVLLNLSIGPKLWVGSQNFSFSIESQIGLAILGLDSKNYKGLGMAHIPIIGQINLRGSSGLNTVAKPGFSIGGGIQYNRTELYGLSQKYKDLGLSRDFFTTYIIQAGGGFGINGFVANGFLRYGFHPETKAQSLNIGMQFDLNVIAYRKNLNNPNSAL